MGRRVELERLVKSLELTEVDDSNTLFNVK